MASTVANGFRTLFGLVAKPIYEIVRSVRREQRDAARNPSSRPSFFRLPGFRPVLPTCASAAPPPPAQLGPLEHRKRKAEDDNNTMPRKKKLFATSPWKDEPWMQFGREPTPPSHIELEAPIVVREPTPPPEPINKQLRLVKRLREDRKHKPRRTAHKFKTFKPRYEPYRRPESPNSPRIYLTQSPKYRYEFMDSDVEMIPSPEKPDRSQSEHVTFTENATAVIETNQSTLTQPASQETVAPPIESTNQIDEKCSDDDDWDANDDPEFRAALRMMDVTHDEKGFKYPILGWVSPETQRWNVKHARKLAKEEQATLNAAAIETPSRPPSSHVSTVERMKAIMPPWAILNQSPIPPSTQLIEEVANSITSPPRFMVGQDNLFESAQKAKEVAEPFTPMKESQNEEPTPRPHPTIKEEWSPTPTPQQTETKRDATPTPQKIDTKSDATPTPEHTEAKSSDTLTKEHTATSQPAGVSELGPVVAQKQKQEAAAFETPLKQLYHLSIYDTDSVHTPKARIFTEQRTVRTTRAQKIREDLEAAKDLYKLVPLGPDWTERVCAAAKNGTGALEPHDIARVVPQHSASRNQDNWLNDEVINAYLGLIVNHGKKGDREGQIPSHHAFNSFFYKKIQSEGAQGVLRWSKRAKVGGKALLETEKLFIPINQGMHWTLCVVEAKNHKQITVYNSMGVSRGREVCNNVLAWIEKELGKDFVREDWRLDPAGHSPQQTNSDDCGVFTITNARQIMLGKMGIVEVNKKLELYGADLIPIQRERIVAELINGALLTAEESKA